MAANAFTLRILIDVPPIDTTPLKRTKKDLEDLGDQSTRTGKKTDAGFKALAGAFTTLVVAKRVKDALFGVVAPAIKLESSLKRLQISTGVSGEELKKLESVALKAAAATAFSPEQAIEGMTALRKATASTDAAMASLTPVMGFAQVSGLEVAKAAEIAGDIFTTFSDVGVGDLGRSFDTLIAVSEKVRADFRDVLPVMGRLGISAKKVGSSFEDMVIAFQIARSSGLSSSQVMTSLDRLTDALGSEKKRKALEAVFGDIFLDAAGNLRPLPNLIADMSTKMNTSTLSVATLGSAMSGAIGIRAARSIFASLAVLGKGLGGLEVGSRKGAAAIDELRRIAAEAAGISLRKLKEALEDTAVSGQRLEQAMQFLSITIGRPMLEIITPVINKLREFLTWINALIQSNTAFGAVMTFVLPKLFLLIGLVTGIILAFSVWKAITLLTGLALNFSGLSVGRTGAALGFLKVQYIKGAFGAKVATLATSRFTGSMILSAGAVGFLSKAIKALLGPWGLLIGAAALLIPALFNTGEEEDNLEKDTVKLTEESKKLEASLAKLEGDTLPGVGKAFADTAIDSDKTLKAFRAFVAETKTVLDFEIPGIDVTTLDKGFTALKELRAEGTLNFKTFQAIERRMGETDRITRKMAAGIKVTDKEWQFANETLGIISVTVRSLDPGAKGLLKSFSVMGKGMKDAISPAGMAFAKIRRQIFLSGPESEAAMAKVVAAAEAQAERTAELEATMAARAASVAAREAGEATLGELSAAQFEVRRTSIAFLEAETEAESKAALVAGEAAEARLKRAEKASEAAGVTPGDIRRRRGIIAEVTDPAIVEAREAERLVPGIPARGAGAGFTVNVEVTNVLPPDSLIAAIHSFSAIVTERRVGAGGTPAGE